MMDTGLRRKKRGADLNQSGPSLNAYWRTNLVFLMYAGKTLYAQLMDHLPWSTFRRIVQRHGGDRYVKSLSCAEHFRAMASAQLTYRECLRDIEACFEASIWRERPRSCLELDNQAGNAQA